MPSDIQACGDHLATIAVVECSVWIGKGLGLIVILAVREGVLVDVLIVGSKVNGKTVTTIEEFASAVSDKVDQVQDSIAEMTLRLVHNRDIGGTDGSPYVANGSTVSLLNIPVNSPLYSDALLSATLEQSGFSESFECSELTDDVPLSKVVSRGAIPMSQIESVAALSTIVSSDGDLTRAGFASD